MLTEVYIQDTQHHSPTSAHYGCANPPQGHACAYTYARTHTRTHGSSQDMCQDTVRDGSRDAHAHAHALSSGHLPDQIEFFSQNNIGYSSEFEIQYQNACAKQLLQRGAAYEGSQNHNDGGYGGSQNQSQVDVAKCSYGSNGSYGSYGGSQSHNHDGGFVLAAPDNLNFDQFTKGLCAPFENGGRGTLIHSHSVGMDIHSHSVGMDIHSHSVGMDIHSHSVGMDIHSHGVGTHSHGVGMDSHGVGVDSFHGVNDGRIVDMCADTCSHPCIHTHANYDSVMAHNEQRHMYNNNNNNNSNSNNNGTNRTFDHLATRADTPQSESESEARMHRPYEHDAHNDGPPKHPHTHTTPIIQGSDAHNAGPHEHPHAQTAPVLVQGSGPHSNTEARVVKSYCNKTMTSCNNLPVVATSSCATKVRSESESMSILRCAISLRSDFDIVLSRVRREENLPLLLACDS
jgi:hypothetical protein